MYDDPNIVIESDPATGAPVPRRRSTSFYDSRRLSANYGSAPIPIPISPSGTSSSYAYSPSNYFQGSPYLSPVPQHSPQLFPSPFVDAYFNLYGQQASNVPSYLWDLSPRSRALNLPSPTSTPYSRVIPLPLFPEEERYRDAQASWSGKIKNFFKGDEQPAPTMFDTLPIHVNNTFNPMSSGIKWNLTAAPYTITFSTTPKAEQSAFQPPLTSCKIVSPHFPWLIEVEKHDNRDYITVVSLIADIRETLKRPLDKAIYSDLSPVLRQMVDEAYRKRCRAIPEEEAYEKALEDGIRRCDLLLGKVHFRGLAQVKSMHLTFEMLLSDKE